MGYCNSYLTFNNGCGLTRETDTGGLPAGGCTDTSFSFFSSVTPALGWQTGETSRWVMQYRLYHRLLFVATSRWFALCIYCRVILVVLVRYSRV